MALADVVWHAVTALSGAAGGAFAYARARGNTRVAEKRADIVAQRQLFEQMSEQLDRLAGDVRSLRAELDEERAKHAETRQKLEAACEKISDWEEYAESSAELYDRGVKLVEELRAALADSERGRLAAESALSSANAKK